MFLSLTQASGYSHAVVYTVLRWIVLMEVVQNAWSFSIFSESKPSQDSTAKRAAATRPTSPLPFPLDQSDIFLDEVSESGGPDDNYHFEDGTYQEDFVARELESYDDSDVLIDGRTFSPSGEMEDLGP